MIKVLIVDDSALIRQVLTRIIDRTGDMKVVGVAGDPYVARELIRETNPDVLTLDVEMPRMDGLAFLEKIMQLRPMPVVMVSTLTDAGSDVAVRALEIGAVDVIAKPKLDIERSLEAYAGVLVSKLRAAAHTRPRRTALLPEPARSAGVILERKAQALPRSTEKIIAIGASTGGTEAIRIVLSQLPADAPAVLIVQHMPESFTKAFAKRLNEQCALSVKEAEDGERLLVGHAYVAPGHSHLLLGRNGANYIAQLDRGEPVNRHRPSVDVLFRSVANEAGPNAYGVILTGMGADGAQGMKEMHDAGAWTVAQDEASCVVYGMPKEALLAGGVDATVALPDIATQLMGRVGMTLHRTRG